MHLITTIRKHLQDMTTDGLIKEHVYTYSEQFNNIAGRCKTPVAVLLLPHEWKLECDAATAREHGKFHVYFLTVQSNLDFDCTQNETLIDDMIDLAVDFVGRLKYADKSVHIEDINITNHSIYDANNRNLTGVHLTLSLKEQQGRCIPHLERC